VHRPEPTVAFGRLDRLRPGYADAVAAARRHGFAVLEREPGGHAAAYGPESVVVELEGEGGLEGTHHRFELAAATLVAALRDLGVDARLGPVEGEYCPGDYSVNLAGHRKLAGFAQRVRGRRWTIGANVTVGDPAPLIAVLTDVYAALELPFDPATVGATGGDPELVADALRRAYSEG
jgi:octanoyl-[GcvH]:protein N-octanoyltransferase